VGARAFKWGVHLSGKSSTCPPELTTGLRFFDPQHCNNAALDPAFNDSLNNDGALDAYAESIVWRLRGVHAMVRYVEASKTFIYC